MSLARKRLGRRIGVHLGAPYIKRLARSCELTVLGDEHRERASARHGAIQLALWHGRGAVGAPFHPTENTTALVSASDDGKLSVTILERLGYETIIGSSSRGGVRALREMISCLERGKNLVITPDGPRGPMHSMSLGLAFMARETGVPVLPAGFAADRAWHLASWDRFTIPKPGSRLVACYGEALTVPRDATSAQMHACSLEIRARIRQAERDAFAHLGLAPDWEGRVPEEPGIHAEDHDP